MGISVTKAGPYFASGEIKFSQLRSNFKETGSGEISASELFRNLNLYDRDPITPDATENDQIASDPFQIAVTWTRVYGPDYVAGQNYVEFMPISNSYPSGSFNFYFGGALVGTLDIATATNTYIQVGAVRYDSHNLLPDSYSVVNADGHVPGQNYVELTAANSQYSMGTFKYYWGGVLQGTLAIQGATVDYVQNGDFRYKGGTLQSDGTYSIERSQNINANFYTISKLQGAQGSQTGPFEYSGQGKNLKASQFRNSIKRYTATQSGTDQFLDMGLKSGSGGIDWDGTNNLDASGVGGNYGRNVQKIINIEGTAYSDDLGTNGAVGGGGVGKEKKAGAKLVLPNPLKAINARIHVKSSGAIFGAGGKGGFFDDTYNHPDPDAQYSDPGKDGGPALSVSHEGVENPTYIHNEGGKIYGGGGGGEQGKQGPWDVAKGIQGCNLGTTQSCSGGSTTCTTGGGYVAGYDEGCHGSGSGGSCGPGEISASLFIASFPCPDGSGYGTISATYCYTQTCVTTPSGSNYVSYGPTYQTTLPEQGRGGRGGNGAAGVPGSPNYQVQTFGDAGKEDVIAVCSGGDAGAGTATNSTDGEPGNAGGQHGSPGESGDGPSPAGSGLSQGEGGGRGGAAICGKYFKTPLIGSTGANYVRGTVGLQCDGTESPEIPIGDAPVVTMSNINYVRINYPAADGTNTQTLNVTGTVTFKFAHIWKDKNDYGFGMDGFKLYDTNGTTVLYSSVVSVDFPQPGSNEIPKTIESQSLTLAEGIYPIEFVNLHAQNTGGTDSNGRSYLKTGNILEAGHKLIFFDGDGLDRNQEVLLQGIGQAGQTSWVRSYDSSKHDTLLADGTYEYVAMHYYWSQFMRDKAVWAQNDDPGTQTSDQSEFQTWFFKPEYSGEYTLRAQSDNKAEFLKNGYEFGFATTEFDSSGVTESTTTFMVTGLDTDPNDTGMSISVTCTNSKVSPTWSVVDADVHVPGQNYVVVSPTDFKYYWGGVLQGTLILAGASIDFVQSADGNFRYKGGSLQADGTYSIERSKRSPELNWQQNPAGVAWEMFIDLPDGSRYIACDSTTAAEGNVFGPAQINYSVTGVNPIDPTHQIAGLSSPTDPAFIVTNKLSDSVLARPYGATSYSIRGKNGAGQTTVTKNIK